MDEEDSFVKIINMITKLEVGLTAVNDGPCNSHSLGKNSEIDFFDVSHQKKS